MTYTAPTMTRLGSHAVSGLILKAGMPNVLANGFPCGCPICGDDDPEYLATENQSDGDGCGLVIDSFECQRGHQYNLVYRFDRFVVEAD